MSGQPDRGFESLPFRQFIKKQKLIDAPRSRRPLAGPPEIRQTNNLLTSQGAGQLYFRLKTGVKTLSFQLAIETVKKNSGRCSAWRLMI